jgi:hypothetical protein
VGAPADLSGNASCCCGKPESEGCTPGSCCGETGESSLPN